MKIDYDKPVKGKLKAGWYWATNYTGGSIRPVYVDADQTMTDWHRVMGKVDQMRTICWQFYRAHLPKPARKARAKGAK